MENTQFTPEVNLQPAVEAASKPSRKLTWIVALVILALVAGAVYYFFFFKGEEMPPSLTTQRSTYQGLMQKELSTADVSYKFLSFDETDKALYKTNYEDKKAELVSKGLSQITLPYTDVNDGMHYVSFAEDMTFEQIVRAMNPNKTEAVIVATWDQAKNNGNGIWVITDNTYFTTQVEVIKNEDLGKYTVPAGKTVIIGGTDDIEIWGAKDGKTKLGKNFPICNQTSAGWYSYILNVDKLSELENTPCFAGIKSIYVQKDESQLTTVAESKFELAYKAGVTPIANLQTYQIKNYIVWMDFEEAPINITVQTEPQSEPQTQAPAQDEQDESGSQTTTTAIEAAAIQIMQNALMSGTGEKYDPNDGAYTQNEKDTDDTIKAIQREVSENPEMQNPANTCDLLSNYLSTHIDEFNSDPANAEDGLVINLVKKEASGSSRIRFSDVNDFTPISGPLNGELNINLPIEGSDQTAAIYTPKQDYLGEDYVIFEKLIETDTETNDNILLYCLNIVAEPQGSAAFSAGTEDTPTQTQEPATTPSSGGAADGGNVGDTAMDSLNVEGVMDTVTRTEETPKPQGENIYQTEGSSTNPEPEVQLPAPPTNLRVSEKKSTDRPNLWFINIRWDAPQATEGVPNLSGYILTWCQKGESDTCPEMTRTKMKLPASYTSAQIPEPSCIASDWVIILNAYFGLREQTIISQAKTIYTGCSSIEN